MRFWQPEAILDPWIVLDLLILGGLLAAAAGLLRMIGPLRRLSVPNAIVAGLLGLSLGPSGAGLIPIDIPAMETIVYHAFALMFIAGGLQSPPRQDRPGAARSIAVAGSTIGVLQAILGLLFVAAWLAVEPLHPGFGLMITLGFQQGPGQALSLGGAWESLGMTDGGQIGLVFATLGFLYCIVLGIPAVLIARRRGLLTERDVVEPSTEPGTHAGTERRGSLLLQVVWVLLVYAAVFVAISGMVSVLPPKLAATAWGLHFIYGSLFAITLRYAARRLGADRAFDDAQLARISVVTVDVTTTGAIAAVRLAVLAAWLVPILLMTLLAGGLTFFGCVWLARRAFPEAPASHALVLFGMGTGTVSTGLALLRMIDPELRGTAARNTVIGATAQIPFSAPMFVGVLPFATTQWSGSTSAALGWPLAALAIYLVALLVCWRVFTPFALLTPLRSLWPDRPDD
ncbi:MAG: hypothetical protein AAGF11_03625 [Myxococcota bacterium]